MGGRGHVAAGGAPQQQNTEADGPPPRQTWAWRCFSSEMQVPAEEAAVLAALESRSTTALRAMQQQHLDPRTPLRLVNEGVAVTERNMPQIFRDQRAQVMQVANNNSARILPSDDFAPAPEHVSPQFARSVLAEHVFGNGRTEELQTTSVETQRISIRTARHLQRALQAKIVQVTRPRGVHAVFKKLDRRGAGALDLDDLIAATRLFNVPAPDEVLSSLSLNRTKCHAMRVGWPLLRSEPTEGRILPTIRPPSVPVPPV